jgi:hypothetical protein
VQINSIRRLGDFVSDRGKYVNGTAQQGGVTTAVQTLAAFVKEKTHSTADGLAKWNKPPPASVGSALRTLRLLAGNPQLGARSFDISQVDVHGDPNLQEFRPTNSVFATGADLRRTNLTMVDFSGVLVTLRRAFLTCATLKDAKLGAADLEFADLSGADLRGADLSKVQHLTARQLTGVTTDNATLLPPGVAPASAGSWDGGECSRVTVGMTGLHSGAGYDNATPCPRTEHELSAAPPELQEAVVDDIAALLAACSARVP